MNDVITESTKFSSWSEIRLEAKKDLSSITAYIEVKKDTVAGNFEEVELTVARNIRNDMQTKVKKARELTLYEFSAISEELIDRSGLTKRQAEVVMMKKDKNFREIADLIGVSPKTAFDTFQCALLKLQKYYMNLNEGVPVTMSDQQTDIYKLYYGEHLKPKEIARRLDINVDTVYVQLNRIKKTLTKKQDNKPRHKCVNN